MSSSFPRTTKPNVPTTATTAQKALFTAVLVDNGPPVFGTNPPHALVGTSTDIDIVLSETSGGTFDAELWWLYADAEVYAPDTVVGTVSVLANGTARVVTAPSAATGLFVRVTNFAGGARANAWAIGRGFLGRGWK
ncbi:MAG: hypothetical protein FJ100_21030 [Deltaproteobacteria bacterium]|nr:hypothetical protein [Deltaproteobacteria bacterium]